MNHMERKNDMHKVMIEAIEGAVTRTVNGKIGSLDVKLTEYIQDDLKWKQDAQPAIDKMKELTGGWKLFISFIGAIGMIAASIFSIKKLLNQ